MHEPNKFSKEIETIKNKGIIGLKKYNGRIQCRVKKKADSAFRRISNLDDKKFETVQSEKEKESEESLWNLWDTIKRNNIHIMGILE